MPMSLKVPQHPLSYTERLEHRSTDDINLVVVHCTELPDMAMARLWGKKVMHQESQTGNSGHFYIDRDGSIEQWVPLDRVAHHVRDYNHKSIGIELVNLGRYPDWYRAGNQQMTEPYPDQQIHALEGLLNLLADQLPGLECITGHEDLDTAMLAAEDAPDIMIRRKLDPGIHFPWAALMGAISLQRIKGGDL
jgi:N-acetylmuramoyl-L-alanine amidase